MSPQPHARAVVCHVAVQDRSPCVNWKRDSRRETRACGASGAQMWRRSWMPNVPLTKVDALAFDWFVGELCVLFVWFWFWFWFIWSCGKECEALRRFASGCSSLKKPLATWNKFVARSPSQRLLFRAPISQVRPSFLCRAPQPQTANQGCNSPSARRFFIKTPHEAE